VRSPTDRFQHFGWLVVYYRKIATHAFLALSEDERWSALREHIRQSSPPNDTYRLNAFESIGATIRPHLLEWLASTAQAIAPRDDRE
jgi:hypothetical protein